MSKKVWLLVVVALLILSIVITFNAKSIITLLIGSLILTLIIFGVSALLVKSIKNFKEKNNKKAILLATLFILAVVILSYIYIILSSSTICLHSITHAHFRTNVLTGECDFGGFSPCVSSDPWYYKSGCEISIEEKRKIARKAGLSNEVFEKCDMICKLDLPENFCTEKVYDDRSTVLCKDIISCDSISCN